MKSNRWLDAALKPMLAICVATLDADGVLLEANAGFLNVISDGKAASVGKSIASTFIQPGFEAFVHSRASEDGEVYRGMLTIGERHGLPKTLQARVWRMNGLLRIIAEYDIAEFRELQNNLTELNDVSAKLEFELVQSNRKLQASEARSREASLHDVLTGVANRRCLEEALLTEVERATRTGGRLCAAMGDLDHFKRVNDSYGHDVGDKVLAAFGAILKENTRKTDLAARFGGEEFVVLMPGTPLKAAIKMTDRLRMAISSRQIEGMPKPLTVSFGVAELQDGELGDSLMRRADAALYTAKELGRNRVVGASTLALGTAA